MFDALPVDFKKFDESQEAKRLFASLLDNIKRELNNADSSIGLALNACFVQLTEKNSVVMNEANFSFQERALLSVFVGQIYRKLKEVDHG